MCGAEYNLAAISRSVSGLTMRVRDAPEVKRKTEMLQLNGCSEQ